MTKWFSLVRGWSTAAGTNIHQLILKSISNFSYQLMKCFSASAHQPLTKPNQLATKLIFLFLGLFHLSTLYSPSYLSIEVNKIAFWLFWYLFFSNWFGSLSVIEIAKFELLEAVLRSGGQEKRSSIKGFRASDHHFQKPKLASQLWLPPFHMLETRHYPAPT